MTLDLEAQLMIARERREKCERDVGTAHREWEETRAQMEEDLDGEIEALRGSYHKRLDEEREAALKFKGENGIMKKRFTTLMKEIEDNKGQLAARLERQDGLKRTIEGLEKEIAVLR